MKKYLSLFLLFICFNVKSHEIKPSVVDFIILDNIATIFFGINAEIVLADINASKYSDTNDAPEADKYNYFRSLPDSDLINLIEERWEEFSEKIEIRSNGQVLVLNLIKVNIEDEKNIELPRDTFIKVESKIESTFDVKFDKSFGSVVIRQFEDFTKEKILFAEYLQPEETSPILSPETNQSYLKTAFEYLIVGFEHIIPKGLDHILFILGIFFYSIKFKPLLMQVTMFTLAHSLTLILATFGILLIPAFIIEPLIALSISYVAFENIFKKRFEKIKKASLVRYIIIFIFGLIHGLGFAFVLSDIGLDTNQLILSLISFNIGVEIAQIGIVIVMFLLMIIPSKKTWYKNLVKIPISLAIGMVGLYWFIERLFF